MNKKMIKIIREKENEHQIIGSLYIYDTTDKIIFSCKTLELPYLNNQQSISSIPCGEYFITEYHSKNFKNAIKINNVKDRKYILIHNGNFYNDIRGCILVGSKFKDINKDGLKDILSSVRTLNTILKKISLPDTLIIEKIY